MVQNILILFFLDHNQEKPEIKKFFQNLWISVWEILPACISSCNLFIYF